MLFIDLRERENVVPMATVCLKGDKKMQSRCGTKICTEAGESGFLSTMRSFHSKHYKVIIIIMIYCQMILHPCFPDEQFVLITAERAKFGCRGNTSQFRDAESLIHEAVLTSAWMSGSIN